MLTGVVLASCYCRNGVVWHSVVHTCAAVAVRKRIVVFAGTLWRSRAIVMLTGIEVVAVVRDTDKVRTTFCANVRCSWYSQSYCEARRHVVLVGYCDTCLAYYCASCGVRMRSCCGQEIDFFGLRWCQARWCSKARCVARRPL